MHAFLCFYFYLFLFIFFLFSAEEIKAAKRLFKSTDRDRLLIEKFNIPITVYVHQKYSTSLFLLFSFSVFLCLPLFLSASFLLSPSIYLSIFHTCIYIYIYIYIYICSNFFLCILLSVISLFCFNELFLFCVVFVFIFSSLCMVLFSFLCSFPFYHLLFTSLLLFYIFMLLLSFTEKPLAA